MERSECLVVTVCATKSYAYAMKSQARRVAANLERYEFGEGKAHVVLATDGSGELEAVAKYYEAILPSGWSIHLLADPQLGEHANYKEQAQMVIARLRTMAFTVARKLRADVCWSLDSDVLPPSNAYRCMRQMLDFDDGYYAVSTCSYPNESFLGGHGSETHPIAEDFLPEEREVPDWLLKVWERSKRFGPETRDAANRVRRISERLKRCPPRGNVFELNAKRWRRRGWLDHAYPAIGKGAIVPSDWCGFGCTLMNREALASANFEGYQGRGTEDLWVVWKQWYQLGLRINCITHVVCDHVIHEKKKGGAADAYTHIRSFHETAGECRGHIRTEKLPWLYD